MSREKSRPPFEQVTHQLVLRVSCPPRTEEACEAAMRDSHRAARQEAASLYLLKQTVRGTFGSLGSPTIP
jgi:hypothetical protein